MTIQKIDKIQRFNYKKIVAILEELAISETNGDLTNQVDSIDYLDVVDGTDKPNTFKGAIYAILNDLENKGNCTIDGLLKELDKHQVFQNMSLVNKIISEYQTDQETELEYIEHLKELEEVNEIDADYERFCALVDPIIENSFIDFDTLDLAKQTLRVKITSYLGANWYQNWHEFSNGEHLGAFDIAGKIADNYDVKLSDIIDVFPTRKAPKKTVTLYASVLIDGKHEIAALEAIETKKQYKLDYENATEFVRYVFGLHAVLNKERDSHKIAFTPSEAVEKCGNC